MAPSQWAKTVAEPRGEADLMQKVADQYPKLSEEDCSHC